MHDCANTQEKLIDLIFDELDPASRDRLLAEVSRCETCRREYRTMSETMQTVDRVIDSIEPPENFWPGYEDRLRDRLTRETAPGFWRRWVEKLAWFPSQPIQIRAAFALGLLAAVLAGWMLLGRGTRTVDTPQIAGETPGKTAPSPEPSRPVPPSDLIAKASPVPEQKRKPQIKLSATSKAPNATTQSVEPPVETEIETEVAINATPAGAPSILGPDTVRHFEKAQMLLRSFRNSNDQGPAADLEYERQASRKLVYQNILLRRQAEAKGVLPAEEMLGQLEPLLLDIANLPEKASSAEIKSIKNRIARQELVAALTPYSSPAAAYNPAQN